jgi:hypothetical protein
VSLPGTVDSSPIYLHRVRVHGHRRDVFLVTTTYGRTLAIDARSGRRLWQLVPRSTRSLEGGPQFTTATPVADPDRRHVYAASPDGHIHKLSVASGHEARGWPRSVTRDPTHEKIAAALNLSGPWVLVTTGGYIGDAPPYQGHVVSISRRSGRIGHVFNSLCSDRHGIIVPSSCAASDSAIWARAGAVVEPRSHRLLVATGNAPFNGRTDWGDSVLELSSGARSLRQSYTPSDQAELNSTDADLGSTAPALVPESRPRFGVQGGKDHRLKLLRLSRLNGRSATHGPRTGGEVQVSRPDGGVPVFTTPAVAGSLVFTADGDGTAAFALRGSRLSRVWVNSRPGTSPVLAGGLLWVYDPADGGLYVYRPSSGVGVARLPAGPGHWSSPIVVDGRVALPEGDANDHRTHGVLDIYSR